MIIISLLAGAFLRIYKIWGNYYFSGELGKELLYVWQLVQAGDFPLVGLATSHEWLTYGPVYYWILIPLVKIFGWSPFILFWVALVASLGGIFLTYFVFKKIVSKKFAVILSFFISLSPLWVSVARLSKLHTFFFILTPIIIYCLYKIWNGAGKYMFWLGLSFGALFSFHYSQIPLLIVFAVAFYIKKKSLKFKNYLMFALGIVIPNITVFIYDAMNGFSMIKNLFLWIPYRLAGFVGIYPKNTLDAASGANTLSAFNDFFGRNLFWDNRFWILGSVIFTALFVTFFIQNRKKYSKDFFVFYIVTSTLVQCISLLIHTSPPLHYFFPIFLNFGLIFSYFTSEFWVRKSTKILTVSIFTLMFAASVLQLRNEHAKDVDYIPLSTQKEISASIVKDAAGKPFSLIRVGPFDYFPENYNQNYQFLIKIDGGKIDQSAKLRYIIYDIESVYVQKVNE